MAENRFRLPPRVQQELGALPDRYPIRYDAEQRTVTVDDVCLPDGWEPQIITVRIELSAQYPQAAPRAVLPGLLRYNGTIPRHWLISGHWLVRGHLGDPIIYYPAWDPQTGTLKTLFETVLEELAAVDTADTGEGLDA